MKLTNILAVVLLIISCYHGWSQITTNPEFPVSDQEVTIIFDSKNESRLLYYTGDLYAHTGVGIEGKGNWNYVIESWGNNNTQPKLTNKGNGIFELKISPDIKTFYGVPEEEQVINMSFVFRSPDRLKQTNDLFVTVYKTGLNIDLQSPKNNALLFINNTYDFNAVTSSISTIKLYLDDELLQTAEGTSISYSQIFSQPGDHKIVVTAKNTEGILVKDSAFFCVISETLSEVRPAGTKKGINYIDESTVRLCIWAPLKEYIFLLGDFNDWKPKNNYQMKKDGNYFWIQLEGLEKNKEYGFQYLIDGNLLIADPYSEKISDPWNDRDIPDSSYPDLYDYPSGKTEGIASVLQTGQSNYNWEIKDFNIPENEKLVIYEMLIRDFTSTRSYKAVIEKLDYLEDLQVNVLELMPINEFEGNDSWGYNPSFYFAPDKFYGSKDDLKKLIDECHKRSIAVVIDMVLNHSYGQSPLVKMYWDNSNNRPSNENPWYNTVSPNQTYSWGYDFNHEKEATQEFVDSVNSFWLNEYNVDGFRFDFTKGFTNKSGDGWAYDASRITILERMADEIWDRKPGALVICEHLAADDEEKELASHGLMLWGNINYKYGEAAMGYVQGNNSDLSLGVYSKRGWDEPNLVSYQESHDEERLIYKCLAWGNSVSGYNTKELDVAIDRMKLNAVFHLLLPGPKMIWQFGELGYEYSINTCDDGVTVSDNCRLSMKPVRWDYTEEKKRAELFRVMADLNYLKKTYAEFSTADFSLSLTGAQKSYYLTNEDDHVIVIGNFALEEATVNVSFTKTGTWYNYFLNTILQISSDDMGVLLQPGEYMILSTREFKHSDINTVFTDNFLNQSSIKLYPNPVTGFITFYGENIILAEILNAEGRMEKTFYLTDRIQNQTIDASFLKKGIYFLKTIKKDNSVSMGRFIKN